MKQFAISHELLMNFKHDSYKMARFLTDGIFVFLDKRPYTMTVKDTMAVKE